ncbi:MAG TPA: putative oxidoreductase C-terminal domain-containing protein [Candidatus Limnocylindria bacterium]|nr:putative oxidoreductase C-terminal domain-containing protein [Candidatus Limnocylindria bacterium]
MTHTLLFLEPGHFHAALTLRERHPLAADEVVVYVREGPDGAREATEFGDLIEAFNRRPQRPTRWRAVVRAHPEPLARLLDERAGDIVILAGRNDRKMALVRRLHDAGLHVLADKPWITSATALPDVRHVLSGGARVMEMMTGRHAAAARIAERLIREPQIFGTFDTGGDEPPIRLTSVHHLEKSVNGAPLRRPPWFFDVRVQGDGLADIPTHLVDQAQRFLAGHGVATDREAELLAARRWSTPVPRALFARVTGMADFPPDLRGHVEGDMLAYAGNAELSFRLRGVRVHLATRWDLTESPGGGDASSAAVAATAARVRLEQGPQTGFRQRLVVQPCGHEPHVVAALQKAMTAWQPDYPGLAAVAAPDGFEIEIPAGPGHEGQFALVLDEFLRSIDGAAPWPDERAADTLAKYGLLARALAVV